MVIDDMSKEECLSVLARGRIARLACALENQPYIVPIFYAYHKSADGESYLYGFTTLGQKVEWMRANPLVCVEWDEIATYNRWESIVVFGRYEELSDSEETEQGRRPTRAPMRASPLLDEADDGQHVMLAHKLLQAHTNWWQPGYAAYAASKHRDQTQEFKALYYRIRIDSVTGRRALPDADEKSNSDASASERGSGSWIRRFLRGAAGNKSKSAGRP
jgi:uncharacterized protein